MKRIAFIYNIRLAQFVEIGQNSAQFEGLAKVVEIMQHFVPGIYMGITPPFTGVCRLSICITQEDYML